MRFNNPIFTNLGLLTKLTLFFGVFILSSQTQTWAQTKVLANEVTYTSPNNKTGGLFGPYNMPTVLDRGNALIDDDNYARLLASPGIVAGLASYKGVIELKFPQTRPANSWSYVRMQGDSGLFKALLGGSIGNLVGGVLGAVIAGNQEIVIDARNGNTSVLSRSSDLGFETDRVKLLQDGNGNYYLAIRPNAQYDRLRITNQIGTLLGFGNEKTLDVYNAFYYENDGVDCGRPFATSFDGSGIIGLEVLDINNQNLSAAIDADLNSHSNLKSSSLLNLNVASSLSQHFFFHTESSETTTLNIKLALGSSGLLNADLLGSIQVLLYDANNQMVYSKSLQSGLLNNPDILMVLQSGNPVMLTFAPGKKFARAEVKLNSVVGLNILGNGVKIYDVQRYNDNSGCPNPEIAPLPVATLGPLEVPSCASTLLDFDNVDFPHRAVDGNNESYAILNADAGSLLLDGPKAGFVKMNVGALNANQITYVRIGYDKDVLNRLLAGSLGKLVADLANDLLLGNQFIQVQAFDANNVEVLNENSRNFFGGTNGIITIVEDNIGRPYLAIKPNSAYSSIKITNHVRAVLPTGKQSTLHVYNACFEMGTDPCFAPNFTSYTGSGLNLSLGQISEAGVTDPYKAISANSSEYSKINLGIAGVAASVYQSIYFARPSQAGDHVQIRVAVEPSSLLSLDLLANYKVRFFNGETQVGSKYTLQQGLLNNIDLLSLFNSGGSVTLDFEPVGIFDRVDIGIESLASININAEPLRVYNVSRYGTACPIVNTPSPFEVSSCASRLVDSHNADEVQNLFDDNFDSYATLKSGAGFLLGLGNKHEGYLEMGYDQDMAAGVTSYIRIDFEETILKALVSGSLGNIVSGLVDGLVLGDHFFEVDVKKNTYDANGAVLSSTTIVSASSNTASAGGNNQIRVVQDAAGRYYIAVTPNQAYNAVRITDKTNSLLGLLAQPNSMNVYGMCTELSNNGCLEAFATSYEHSGLNLSVSDLSGAGVTNMEYALDANSQHYSEISNGTLGVGTSTKQWIFFNTISGPRDVAKIKFKTQGGGVDVDVLGGLEIKAYLGNVEVAQFDFHNGIINGINIINLLNNNQMAEINFKPGVPYDRITVGIKTLVQTSVFPPIQLYGVEGMCGGRSLLITNPNIYQRVKSN